MMQTAYKYDCTPHFVHFAYKFTGKERDTESGNDYFGARYYASSMGRWLSPDPGWFMFANMNNPQSLNLYSHALNSPLVWIDIDGLELVRAVLSNGQSVVVDDSIAGNVMSLVDDAQAAGIRVTITSGFRSVQDQRSLYNAYRSGRSRYPAARPGHSGHNSGQSIDISTGRMNRAQRNQLADIARRNGLPYAGAIDAVHFGAGFGVAIDPALLQENGIDHPTPQSTIVDGGVTTVIVTDTATTIDVDNSTVIPDQITPVDTENLELTPQPLPPPPPPPTPEPAPQS
jgi:RHS repeat-associated protein